jgi:hypothetical protein
MGTIITQPSELFQNGKGHVHKEGLVGLQILDIDAAVTAQEGTVTRMIRRHFDRTTFAYFRGRQAHIGIHGWLMDAPHNGHNPGYLIRPLIFFHERHPKIKMCLPL